MPASANSPARSVRGSLPGRRTRSRPRSRGSRRVVGLSPHLGRGASQLSRYRQRRHVARHCAHRRRDRAHPGRRRRDHAAESLALSSSPNSSARSPSSFPGRIDLGLGRAPGTDGLTVRALRRAPRRADTFPDDVRELQAYLAPVAPGQRVQAVPAAGTMVPLWILGSQSLRRGTRRRPRPALRLCLPLRARPVAAGTRSLPPVASSRRRSSTRPYAMVGVNVIAADSDDEATRLAHLPADVVRPDLPEPAGSLPAAHRRHRAVLVADGEDAGLADARALDRGLARPCAPASTRWSPRPAPMS